MKKSFWKISLSLLLVGSACLYSFPVRADNSVTQQQQQLATTLQQLIATLTAQLQQLEQQLTAEQTSDTTPMATSTISAATAQPSASLLSTTSTFQTVFTNLVVQATSTRPMPSEGDDSEIYFSFKTLSPAGTILPNTHLHINGMLYISDTNGLISLGATSRVTTTFQFVISVEGWPSQPTQTITLTPPPYVKTSWYPPNYTDPCAAHYIGPAIKSSGHLTCA
jgi:hypothetical protein